MSMSDRDHEIEGALLISIRKTVVALERIIQWVDHGSTKTEARLRQRELAEALFKYENMMMERDEHY